MCFEFSSFWKAFNVFWGTLGSLLSLSSLLREIMGGIASYIKLPWHSQKFILCGSLTLSVLMGKILSCSLVSIRFQAPLFPIDGVSSCPVRDTGQGLRLFQTSLFSVGHPNENRHRVAGGRVGQD